MRILRRIQDIWTYGLSDLVHSATNLPKITLNLLWNDFQIIQTFKCDTILI